MGNITTGSIGVKNLEISVKKGLYETESLVENRFRLSAEVSYDEKALEPGAYLNYERLADIMRKEMLGETRLLEAVARQFLDRVLLEFPAATSAGITIEKLHPAFEGVSMEAVVVRMHTARLQDHP